MNDAVFCTIYLVWNFNHQKSRWNWLFRNKWKYSLPPNRSQLHLNFISVILFILFLVHSLPFSDTYRVLFMQDSWFFLIWFNFALLFKFMIVFDFVSVTLNAAWLSFNELDEFKVSLHYVFKKKFQKKIFFAKVNRKCSFLQAWPWKIFLCSAMLRWRIGWVFRKVFKSDILRMKYSTLMACKLK